MDKIVINEGGMPLFLGDINFIQNIYTDVLNSIMYGLSNDSEFVIGGITFSLTGADLTVTSGYVYFNHEIFYVPQHIIANYSDVNYYVFEVTETNEDLRLFADNSSHYAIKKRVATLVFYDGQPPQGYLTMHAANISRRLATTYKPYFINNSAFNKNFATQTETLNGAVGVVLSPQNLQQHGTWQEPLYNTGWSDGGGVSVADGLRYRKTTDNHLEICGCVQSGATIADVIFNLPVGYRPTKVIPFWIALNQTGDLMNCWVSTNGDLNQIGGVARLNEIIYFNVKIPLN